MYKQTAEKFRFKCYQLGVCPEQNRLWQPKERFHKYVAILKILKMLILFTM